jgi:hypothetical protein
MSTLERKRFENPDEVRTPPLQTVQVVVLGSHVAAKLTMQPGWSWSECVKPIAGGESCQLTHAGFVESGRLQVEIGDESMEIGAGDAYLIPPGHDARVVGDETFVSYEFDQHSAATYAAGT